MKKQIHINWKSWQCSGLNIMQSFFNIGSHQAERKKLAAAAEAEHYIHGLTISLEAPPLM